MRLLKKLNNLGWLVAAGLALPVTWLNVIWRGRELRPPHWDMGRHLWTSLLYLDQARKFDWRGLMLGYHYYPPLVYLNALIYYGLFGTGTRIAVLSNFTFLVILAVSIYAITREFASRSTALIAAFMALATPMLVTQFKEFQIDAPLTAMVAASLALLIKSRAFSNRRYSLFFGVVFGLGMLTKWTFPLVFALPLAWASFLVIKAAIKNKNYQPLVNAIIAAILAAAIALPWYWTNHHIIKIDLLQNGVNAGVLEGDPPVGTWASNSWYFFNLVNNQLYLFPMVLFIIGLVYALCKKRMIYPLLLTVGTLVFFTFLRNKDARYTLPALAGIIPISVAWIDHLKPHWSRALKVSLVIYSGLAFWAISFGLSGIPSDSQIVIGSRSYVVFAQHGYIIGPPSHEDWHLEEAFRLMALSPDKTMHYEGDDSIWFNTWAQTYYTQLYRVDFADQRQARFWLIKSAVATPIPDNFELANRWILPDRSTLSLLQRK